MFNIASYTVYLLPIIPFLFQINNDHNLSPFIYDSLFNFITYYTIAGMIWLDTAVCFEMMAVYGACEKDVCEILRKGMGVMGKEKNRLYWIALQQFGDIFAQLMECFCFVFAFAIVFGFLSMVYHVPKIQLLISNTPPDNNSSEPTSTSPPSTAPPSPPTNDPSSSPPPPPPPIKRRTNRFSADDIEVEEDITSVPDLISSTTATTTPTTSSDSSGSGSDSATSPKIQHSTYKIQGRFSAWDDLASDDEEVVVPPRPKVKIIGGKEVRRSMKFTALDIDISDEEEQQEHAPKLFTSKPKSIYHGHWRTTNDSQSRRSSVLRPRKKNVAAAPATAAAATAATPAAAVTAAALATPAAAAAAAAAAKNILVAQKVANSKHEAAVAAEEELTDVDSSAITTTTTRPALPITADLISGLSAVEHATALIDKVLLKLEDKAPAIEKEEEKLPFFINCNVPDTRVNSVALFQTLDDNFNRMLCHNQGEALIQKGLTEGYLEADANQTLCDRYIIFNSPLEQLNARFHIHMRTIQHRERVLLNLAAKGIFLPSS